MRDFFQSFSRRERYVFGLTVALVLAWYGCMTARVNGNWVGREPQGYYPLLTDAVLSGQTYLKLEPDARLKALPDPWAGPQGVPRAHDASYYDGHYYLYFGIAPVILLYAPWRLLTGTYLAEGVGTGVFCGVGFVLAALFYLRCKRRFFPGLSAGWTFLAVLTLGLGSYVQVELNSSDFYQVPIACAFACSLGAAHAVLSAVLAAAAGRRVVALAIASVLAGSAVGARPNYVFDLLPLGFVALWLWWRQRREPAPGPSRGWLLLAATGPAALIGGALAAYNYTRFGSIFEFGLKYQLAAIDMRHFELLSPRFISHALRAYFLAGKDYTPYYPFVRQNADTFGLIPWVPFALLAFVFPVTWWRRDLRQRAWVLGAGFPLAIGLVNLGTLLAYFYQFDRYEVDFVPALMLAAVLTASILLNAAGTATPGLRKLVRFGVVGLALFTIVHAIFLNVPTGMDQPDVRAFARVLEYPAFWGEKLAGVRPGPLSMEVEFPAAPAPQPEPLVSTGLGRDLVYARFTGPEQVQFGFFHEGAGGPLSEPTAITPGRRYRLTIDLGGLYPPPEHPAFAGWDQDDIDTLRRRVQVSLDGRTMLRASSPFYASDPLSVWIGVNPRLGGIGPRFTGRILRTWREGMPSRTTLHGGSDSGPVRLLVHFPPFAAMVGQPLVCTGRHGAGDLVYVFYLAPGKVRFGHDSWNGGAVETGPVWFDPDEDQVIDIDMGSLYPDARNLRDGHRLFRLRFNGQDLISVPRPFNPSTASEVVFGYNAIQASTAEVMFGGNKIEEQRLKTFPAPSHDGAVLLTVELPAERVGRSDPLVVTGRPGAGDFVYLRYPDAQHLQIGFSHWGGDGPVSDPIPIPPGPSLDLEISLGSLYPADEPAWSSMDAAMLQRLRATVQVRLNGRVVWQHAAAAYPAAAAQVYCGQNPIGGSSCGAEFSGRILKVERVGAARLR